jgi:AhpD family alkylhydroperoxidase
MHSALLWARSPKLFLGVAFLYGMFDRTSSPINPVLRSLVTVRVSQLNGCRFCVELNSATLLQRGVDLEKVNALDAWRQSTLFGDIERIALELTGLIAFQNLSGKFNSALGVPPQGFCRVHERQ